MLTTSRLSVIIPVRDMDREKEFYEKDLGLAPQGTLHGDAFVFSDGGSAVELLRRENAKPTGFTTVSFEVSDLEDEIHTLEDRGVHFEDYDLPGLKTTDHIATTADERSAWFTDPEGNILCLHEMTL